VTRVLRGRIESNALKHKPSTRAGVMITGGGYQGKTGTACEVAADFEDAWLDLHHHLNPDAVWGAPPFPDRGSNRILLERNGKECREKRSDTLLNSRSRPPGR